MRSKAVVFVLVLMVLLRCSSPSPTAGGSGTETVNTFVSLSGGKPAAGAVVKVIDAGGWADSIQRRSSPVLESTTVAGNGSFSLATPSSRVVNLQIDLGAAGSFLHRVRKEQLIGDTLILDSTHTYTTATAPSISSDIAFRLTGTTYASTPTSSGGISIAGIPSGIYALVAVGNGAVAHPVVVRGLDLRTSVRPSQTPLQFTTDNLLIDDFETGVGPSTISNLYPGIFWYTYSDSGAREWDDTRDSWVKVSDSFEPVGGTWTQIGAADDERGGKALHFKASLDYPVAPPWAGAGFRLKSATRQSVDLRDMDSFSLRSRGNGALTIRLETETYDSIGSGHSQFSAVVNLTDSWQTQTIPVSTLSLSVPLDSTQQYVDWETVSQAVNKIEFEFSGTNNTADTVELYLDDLYLNGVTTQIFMR